MIVIRSTKDFESLSFSCCEILVCDRTRELVEEVNVRIRLVLIFIGVQ